MTEQFIQVYENIFGEDELDDLCELSGLDEFAVLGRLCKLWAVTKRLRPDGKWSASSAVHGQSADTPRTVHPGLTRMSKKTGLDESFLGHAMACGFIAEDEENDALRICGWVKWTGKGAVKRAEDAARKRQDRRKVRKKKAAQNVHGPSVNSPEPVRPASEKVRPETERETETETEKPPAHAGGAGGGPKTLELKPQFDTKGMGAHCVGPHSPAWWPPRTEEEFLDAPYAYREQDPRECSKATTQREFLEIRFRCLDGRDGRETWLARFRNAWQWWFTTRKKTRWKSPQGFYDSIYSGGPGKPDYDIVVTRWERRYGKPGTGGEATEAERKQRRESQRLEQQAREKAVLENHDPDYVAALMAGKRAQITASTRQELPAWVDDDIPPPDDEVAA